MYQKTHTVCQIAKCNAITKMQNAKYIHIYILNTIMHCAKVLFPLFLIALFKNAMYNQLKIHITKQERRSYP